MTSILNGIKRFIAKPGEFKKAYVALLAVLGYLVTSGFVHGVAYHDVSVAIGILTFIGVTLFKNSPPSEDVSSTPSSGPAPTSTAPVPDGSTATDTTASVG